MAVGEAGPASGKMYSLTEVKKHNTEEDCWIIVHGKVGGLKSLRDLLTSAFFRSAISYACVLSTYWEFPHIRHFP